MKLRPFVALAGAAALSAALAGPAWAAAPAAPAPAAGTSNAAGNPAAAVGQFSITAVTEKKLTQIPDGPLYWRIENFPTLAAAQAAAGPTALAAEISDKVWLLTLGPKGGATAGGTRVAEVGPITRVTAPEYLIRLNNAVAAPGSKTSVHTHPGTEAFYILSGKVSQKTPNGVSSVEAGQSLPGFGPNTVMEVSNPGTVPMNALVMFLVDATKPFSVPAMFN
jgi:quercetin dioxygenase-like cupin family protein